MDEAANAWPERLRLHPARCGCPISYDESLLLACVADASRDARSAFDAWLHEMNDQSMRDRLLRAQVGLARLVGRFADWQNLTHAGHPTPAQANVPRHPVIMPPISHAGVRDCKPVKEGE